MVAPANGINRVGFWLSAIVAGLVIVGMIGSVFYVAFEVRADSILIEAQATLLRTFADQTRALELKINGLQVAMNEIETQFCGEDIVRNLMHASDQRIQSMLWQKTFPGNELPTNNAYYPTICNRRTTAQ